MQKKERYMKLGKYAHLSGKKGVKKYADIPRFD